MKKLSLIPLSLILLIITIIIPNLACASVTNNFAWKTFQANDQRMGFTESPAPNNNQTFWTFQTGGPIASSPVVASGIVFVCSLDGNLYAVNATSGEEVWSATVDSNGASPTLTNDKIIVTSRNGSVFALNMFTGKNVWSQSLSEFAGYASPLVVESRVFVGGNTTVLALNEEVGIRLYEEDIPHTNGISRLIYTDGLVIAFSHRNQTEVKLNGFEARNARGRFAVTLTSWGSDRYFEFEGMEDPTIFTVIEGGEGNSSVFGLNTMGMQIWERQKQGKTAANPAAFNGTVYVPTDNFIYALITADGIEIWKSPTNAESSSSPAIADGKVFFGLDDGCVYALDASNGNLVWNYQTNGPVRSSPAISDGLLFIGSDDGRLYAIGYPKIQEFKAGAWNDKTYEVCIKSSAEIVDFNFDQSLKKFNLNLTSKNPEDYCNLTFPSTLLTGSFSITANENQPLTFEEKTDSEITSLYFNLPKGIETISVVGEKAIPEFSSFTILVLAISLFTLVAMFYKKGTIKTRKLRYS